MPDNRLLHWFEDGNKKYELGVEDVILFPYTEQGALGNGVAWDGVTAINDNKSGGEANKFYAEDSLYATVYGEETYGVTLEAYFHPEEFEECLGDKEVAPGAYATMQKKRKFGLAYKTLVGNDIDGKDHAYEWHFVYKCEVQPVNKNHETINDNVDIPTNSYTIDADKIDPGVTGLKKLATFVVKSEKADPTKLAELETLLYGTAAVTADPSNSIEAADAIPSVLPLPARIVEILSQG